MLDERGTRQFVRSNNGPEFITKHLLPTLAGSRVEERHIHPGRLLPFVGGQIPGSQFFRRGNFPALRIVSVEDAAADISA